MESRSGFSPADLRAAALLTRGEPETVEGLLEIGERVLRDSTHIDPAHDHADTARLLLEAAIGRSVEDLPVTLPLLASQGVPTWHRDSWVEPRSTDPDLPEGFVVRTRRGRAWGCRN